MNQVSRSRLTTCHTTTTTKAKHSNLKINRIEIELGGINELKKRDPLPSATLSHDAIVRKTNQIRLYEEKVQRFNSS